VTLVPPELRDRLAEEIAAAGGREVCFVASLDSSGAVRAVRPVARGTPDMVLALPGVALRGEMLLHNHPGGDLEPSAADLNVAAQLYQAGVGFGIIDNDASSLYVVAEVPRARSYEIIDAVATADILGPGGPVAAAFGQFEDRPGQRDMASFIADVYNEGGVSLLEAGTGVGKSFAYLVPAFRWAKANDERTLVSTNTINLQEQLVGRDLPFLGRVLAEDDYVPTYALLKGWTNYICLARLEMAQSGQASLLEPERLQELESLVAWADKTSDGSLADMSVMPSEEVWDEVCAEGDLCTRLDCPKFDGCFVFKARRRAAEADVIVVNHHLLTADLAVRRAQGNWQDAAVLPPYKRLILDEAHHLEDVAAQHLGAQVTSRGVTRLLSRLERGGRGLIPTLMRYLAERNDAASTASIDLLRRLVLPEVGAARAHATYVFTLLCEKVATGGGDVVRLDDAFSTDPVWDAGLSVQLDNLINTFSKLGEGVSWTRNLTAGRSCYRSCAASSGESVRRATACCSLCDRSRILRWCVGSSAADQSPRARFRFRSVWPRCH